MNDSDKLENTYEQIFLSIKALGVGIWDYYAKDDVLICNRRWYEIVGARYGSIRSVAEFKKFIHPDDVEVATSADEDGMRRLLETGDPYQVQFRICRPDGTIRLLKSVASVLYHGSDRDIRAVGCIADITKPHVDDPPPKLPPDEQPAPRRRNAPLSARECECLRWVSLGKTAWETAAIMAISHRTVEFHLANAVRKLSASNKIHAAFIAAGLGLL